jgi:hypothetical protein
MLMPVSPVVQQWAARQPGSLACRLSRWRTHRRHLSQRISNTPAYDSNGVDPAQPGFCKCLGSSEESEAAIRLVYRRHHWLFAPCRYDVGCPSDDRVLSNAKSRNGWDPTALSNMITQCTNDNFSPTTCSALRVRTDMSCLKVISAS